MLSDEGHDPKSSQNLIKNPNSRYGSTGPGGGPVSRSLMKHRQRGCPAAEVRPAHCSVLRTVQPVLAPLGITDMLILLPVLNPSFTRKRPVTGTRIRVQTVPLLDCCRTV
jgi:hypothetical protein